MIPNKIYIPIYPNYNLDGEHLGEDWMYEPHKEFNNAEYIRKDALLEFINEKLQESADRLDFRTNKAYAEVLDKLNNF